MVIGKNAIKRIVALLVIAGLAWGGYCLFRPETAEAQIRKVLTAFCRNASKSGGEKATAGLLKNRALGQLFGPKTPMDFRAETFSGTYSPEEIAGNAARMRMLFAHVHFSMDDLGITMESPVLARAEFTGRLTGLTKNGAKLDEVRELVCRLEKIDGVWKITGITVREILER